MSDFCKKHNIDHYGTWCGECVMLWKKHSDEYKKLKNKMKLNFSKELNKQILNLLNRLNKVGSKIPTTERGNMTREEKINGLSEKYREENFRHGVSQGTYDDIFLIFKAGILAGIRLRDEELLAMEFDEESANHEAYGFYDCCGHYSFVEGARWQFKQIIKEIKGDG